MFVDGQMDEKDYGMKKYISQCNNIILDKNKFLPFSIK